MLLRPAIFAFGLGLVVAVSSAVDFQERAVTFKGAEGVDLAGTLTLPAGEAGAQYPALVLLAGSGPTDRDGNQPPAIMTDLLKQMAHALAVHGVASVRFDKRGIGESVGGLPSDPALLGDFAAWENYVDDVTAAYDFLREQPQIHSRRVGILGHSEGGTFALFVAKKLTDDDAAPAALILLSTPARKSEQVIAEQLTRLLGKQGANEEQTKFFLDANHRIAKTIEETAKVPLDVPAGMAPFYPSYLGRFLKSMLAVEPRELAAKYPGPVLIVMGEKDSKMSPAEDMKIFEAALKGRPADDHQVILVPGASHNLKPVKDENDPGLTGELAPEVAERIGGWAAEKLNKAAK